MTTVVFEDPAATARCVWREGTLVYLGLGGEAPGLVVVDASTREVLRRIAMPFDVTDVVVCGQRVCASTGPGSLATWSTRACSDEPTITSFDADEPILARSPEGELFWGNASGEVQSERAGKLWRGRTPVTRVLVDEQRVYVGRGNGTAEVWDRAARPRRPVVLSCGKRRVDVALSRGSLWTLDEGEELLQWRIESLEVVLSWSPVGKRLASVGDGLVVSFGGRDPVVKLLGERVERMVWHPSDAVVADICSDERGLWIAAGSSLRYVEADLSI